MYAQLRKGIVLAVLAISGMADAQTLSQDVTAARQETQIWTTYALSPHLRAHDLKVSVKEGKATLTGKVEEGVHKELAEQIALGVAGIKAVDNQITVQADYVPPEQSETSSYGQLIDDATITATIKSKLVWSKYADGLTTNVDTKAGKVTLRGEADSVAAKALAGRLAMNTRGVVAVNNQLTAVSKKPGMADSAKNVTAKAGREIADGWITAKVKSMFMYSKNVDSADISVDTKNGIVTLSGRVNSGVERALAIELAENVRGVKSVDSKNLTI
jgi:hyperosmotically inducible protein